MLNKPQKVMISPTGPARPVLRVMRGLFHLKGQACVSAFSPAIMSGMGTRLGQCSVPAPQMRTQPSFAAESPEDTTVPPGF